MRKIAQVEWKPLPSMIKIPYTWTKPQMGEMVQIETSDRHMMPIAIGEVSKVEAITEHRWAYEVTVMEVL